MRLKLTTPDGRHFEIDADKIDELEEAQPGVWAPTVKAVITCGGQKQGVRETFAEIDAMRDAK